MLPEIDISIYIGLLRISFYRFLSGGGADGEREEKFLIPLYTIPV